MSKASKRQSAEEIIKQRRNQALDRQGWASLLFRVLILCFAGWLLLTQVFLLTQASGNGMFPAVKDGDLVIGFRWQQEYAQNDVIVYTVDGQTHVGRIAARQTDVVTLTEDGALLVNGTAQSGEIMYPTYAKEGLSYPYTVPESHVFVLGDYRTQTEDSRDFGPIPMKDVEGKVITLLRRRGL